MLFIVAIFLVVVALVVTGIIFIVFGIENKKKGGKGKLFGPMPESNVLLMNGDTNLY